LRRAISVVGAASALALGGATCAVAAFVANVQGSGTSLAAYTVPAPTGIACAGLSLQSTSRLTWNAVAPRAGDSVVYAVTVPAGTTTTTAATTYQLPAVALSPGQYAVRTQISSGWRSQPATITVGLNLLGILYTCSVP
jgi:hypothetical protein